jgi:hypothetical protein
MNKKIYTKPTANRIRLKGPVVLAAASPNTPVSTQPADNSEVLSRDAMPDGSYSVWDD